MALPSSAPPHTPEGLRGPLLHGLREAQAVQDLGGPALGGGGPHLVHALVDLRAWCAGSERHSMVRIRRANARM